MIYLSNESHRGVSSKMFTSSVREINEYLVCKNSLKPTTRFFLFFFYQFKSHFMLFVPEMEVAAGMKRIKIVSSLQ